MATIVKRKSKYSVIYRYLDENGKEGQKWETFETNAQAKKRLPRSPWQQAYDVDTQGARDQDKREKGLPTQDGG